MRMSRRSLAVLVPLALAVVAVPSVAGAITSGSGKTFYGCADADGFIYASFVGGSAQDNCNMVEDWVNEPEEGQPAPSPRIELTVESWNQQGPAGSSLAGYKQLNKPVKIVKGSSIQYLSCGSGKVPVAGGADSSSSSVTIRGSFPTASGWKVRFANTSSSTKDATMYVVCTAAPVTS